MLSLLVLSRFDSGCPYNVYTCFMSAYSNTSVFMLLIVSVRCVCVFNFYVPCRLIAILRRMCSFVSVVVPILETLAACCALPALFYLCEVTEDRSVLAELEL
jgi:hypothetical protein